MGPSSLAMSRGENGIMATAVFLHVTWSACSPACTHTAASPAFRHTSYASRFFKADFSAPHLHVRVLRVCIIGGERTDRHEGQEKRGAHLPHANDRLSHHLILFQE